MFEIYKISADGWNFTKNIPESFIIIPQKICNDFDWVYQINFIQQDKNKINKKYATNNPKTFYINYFYEKIKNHFIYHVELLQKVYHPKRINYLLEKYYNNDLSRLDELFNYF
jgi:hypothetical protein